VSVQRLRNADQPKHSGFYRVSIPKDKVVKLFWKKKSDPNPLGVPLGDLMTMLRPTSIKARLEDRTLIAQHEHYATRIEVAAPETGRSGSGKIRAVVRMMTELPTQILELYKEPEARMAMTRSLNVSAALSAVSLDGDRAYIGSRLTLSDADDQDAWRTLHLPAALGDRAWPQAGRHHVQSRPGPRIVFYALI
jgi:hypothetical protein